MNDADIRKHRNELKEWYKKTKAEKHCTMCGGDDHKQFHHVWPHKKISSVSRMVHNGESKEIIIEEMEKCIILCRSCHCKEHNKLRKKKML